jgi:hypothetical protein
MHAKKRNGRVMLYRSSYVRKGANGNTHGYPEQKFVASIGDDAQEIPAALAAKLSPEERAYVENKVVVPARKAAEQVRRAAEAHERDPAWRLDEALRLLRDAGGLVSTLKVRVDAGRVTALTEALDALLPSANVRRDPLDAVLAAVREATAAVKSNHYGSAPAGALRETSVYKRWRAIGEAVDAGNDSLLRALQARGWAAVCSR